MSKMPQMNTNNTSQKKSNYQELSSTKSNYFLIPLMFVIGILPFIIRYHKYKSGLSIFKWFLEDDTNIDFFLYFKMVFFIIACSIIVLLVAYKIYKEKNHIKLTPIFIPLGVYALLIVLSTAFSKYPSFGIKGIYEQFESVFVLLGYCLLIFYAFLYIKTEENVNYILNFFLKCVIFMAFLGTMQAIGCDLVSSDFGFKLALPRNMWADIDSFGLKFGKYCTFLTVYNPNYVGVYVSLVAPIFICLSLTSKNIKNIVYYLIAVLGLMISLYGSKSAAGLVGICVAILLIVIFLRKYIFKNLKIVIPVIIVGLACISILAILKFDTIKQKVQGIVEPATNVQSLTDIITDKDITIMYKGNTLKVNTVQGKENGYKVSLTDSNNNEVAATIAADTNASQITDKRFTGITVTPATYNKTFCLSINIDGKDWVFCNQLGDGTYYYLNGCGRWVKIIKAESAIFTGHESFATGRGYLWSRTIPLLKKHILLGSGADTFVMMFPQQDYVDYNYYGFQNEIVTKPHSMYLQIGVQTGVLSLIAFLVFYFMYFCSSVKLYMNGKFDNLFSQVGVGIFIGTVCFMVTSISNDSCICVSPVFWGLTGIGIAINHQLKGRNVTE